MPATEVRFFQEYNGRVPVLDWLSKLRDNNRRAYAKCVARIRRLADLGHELRRPETDYLKDGLYELRILSGRVHYRLLYFYHSRHISVLVHAVKKEGRVPPAALEIALRRKRQFEKDPKLYSLVQNIRDTEG